MKEIETNESNKQRKKQTHTFFSTHILCFTQNLSFTKNNFSLPKGSKHIVLSVSKDSKIIGLSNNFSYTFYS